MSAGQIEVLCNGESKRLDAGRTLAEHLPHLTQACDFAVAINAVFVPKSAYAETWLADGDRIELVIPMQGG
jgi:sulfur carrier protein